MKGAEALAAEYMATGNDLEEQVDMLIRNQVIKCGASGFLTSLGGAITLPVALPANVLSVLYMQLQMIAAIAIWAAMICRATGCGRWSSPVFAATSSRKY